jgi:hypothetical protein
MDYRPSFGVSFARRAGELTRPMRAEPVFAEPRAAPAAVMPDPDIKIGGIGSLQ